MILVRAAAVKNISSAADVLNKAPRQKNKSVLRTRAQQLYVNKVHFAARAVRVYKIYDGKR